MTLDTYGLPEEEYLAVFKQKAEFACKALRIVGHVATDYNIKMEPKLFWDLYQEIGYATDDACRVKQKQVDGMLAIMHTMADYMLTQDTEE